MRTTMKSLTVRIFDPGQDSKQANFIVIEPVGLPLSYPVPCKIKV
jgi:hypothetical protein